MINLSKMTKNDQKSSKMTKNDQNELSGWSEYDQNDQLNQDDQNWST